MIKINYYPHVNQGCTFKMSGKIDPWRIYLTKVVYKLYPICTYPDFKFGDKEISIQGEYILFSAKNIIDFNVVTSLN